MNQRSNTLKLLTQLNKVLNLKIGESITRSLSPNALFDTKHTLFWNTLCSVHVLFILEVYTLLLDN